MISIRIYRLIWPIWASNRINKMAIFIDFHLAIVSNFHAKLCGWHMLCAFTIWQTQNSNSDKFHTYRYLVTYTRHVWNGIFTVWLFGNENKNKQVDCGVRNTEWHWKKTNRNGNKTDKQSKPSTDEKKKKQLINSRLEKEHSMLKRQSHKPMPACCYRTENNSDC